MTRIIDGRRMTTRADAHAELARALDFPDWYGANLDALYDVLTDLEVPVRIDLIDWPQAQLS